MHIIVLHGDKAAEIDAGAGLAAAIAAVICSEMEVAPAKSFNILPAGNIVGTDIGPELAAAIATVICSEKEVAPAKPFRVFAADKIAEIDVGPKFTVAVTTAIYRYLEEYAPSYQAGRIKITSSSIQPAAVVAQSNWQLAGRISLLDSRSNFLKMRRR